MSNTTDVELAAVGCDTALAVEVKHDDKLSEAEGAYVQAAVLYTSVGGRRRLRVLNSAFNCCTQVADLFRCCELDTYVNFIAKQGYLFSIIIFDVVEAMAWTVEAKAVGPDAKANTFKDDMQRFCGYLK